MPANKFALLRYRIIDRCINNHGNPYPSKENLRTACEEALYGSDGEHISVSTIEKDIWSMRNESELGYYAPISYHRDHKGYFYEEEGYSINEVQLNEEDLDAIRFAANTLIQFRDLPIFQQFDQAIGKIADRLAVAPNLDTTGVDKYMQFESTPSARGSKYLSPLLHAARNNHPVILSYRKFSGEAQKKYSVHPYLLKEYQNRWYVIGYDNYDGFVKTYSLDRVTKLLIVGKSFEIDLGFDYDRFFKYNIGITTLDKEPEDILLSASPLEGSYLKSQPLHWSQNVIIDNENECKIRLRVVVTKELAMKILSMGGGIKVISPKSLKNQIAAEIKKASSNYF